MNLNLQLAILIIVITSGLFFTLDEDIQFQYTQTRINQINSTHYSCDNNQQVLLLSTLNDDYCDCNDGSDENKTNACFNGLFKCRNKLYQTTIISTSKLNDGYCDCCDGSDENVDSNCTNTCVLQSQQLYDKINSEFTTLTQVINSYSTEQNEAFFNYNQDFLMNIQSSNKKYLETLRQKNLLSSYIYYLSSKLTYENEDRIDENGIQLSKVVKALEESNQKLKMYDDFFNSNKNQLGIYQEFGVFKDLSQECFDVKYDYYMCQLCFSTFNCNVETKDSQQKTIYFGKFKGFKGNVAYFDNGGNCRNYDIKLSAEIVFECGFKKEFKFVAKVNKCLYRFNYYSQIGCNSYKLNNLINELKDIV